MIFINNLIYLRNETTNVINTIIQEKLLDIRRSVHQVYGALRSGKFVIYSVSYELAEENDTDTMP